MKRYLPAPRRFVANPLKLAVRNPAAAVDYLLARSRFGRFFGVPGSRARDWLKDLLERAALPQELASRWESLAGRHISEYPGGATIGPQNEVLYLIIRATTPDVVVETGVAWGFSSAYILQALADNCRGALHSIDLPTTNPEGYVDRDGRANRDYVRSADETGIVVPSRLRNRWRLELGSSSTVLPRLLATLQPVDIFWHDSDHSYENMWWEFGRVWPHIRPGGYLVSDDINRNSAFDDFARGSHSLPFKWLGRGAIRRPLGT